MRPQTADTTTVGFVVKPAGSGVEFAIDYFRINIKNAIEQAHIQGVFSGCQLQDIASDCALVTFDPTKTYTEVNPATGKPQTFKAIDDVRALALNGASYNFKGLDSTGNWTKDLGSWVLSENMMRQDFQQSAGIPSVNIVGQTAVRPAHSSRIISFRFAEVSAVKTGPVVIRN